MSVDEAQRVKAIANPGRSAPTPGGSPPTPGGSPGFPIAVAGSFLALWLGMTVVRMTVVRMTVVWTAVQVTALRIDCGFPFQAAVFWFEMAGAIQFYLTPGCRPGSARGSGDPSSCLTPGCRPGSATTGRDLLPHHAFALFAHITWHTWQRVGCISESAARHVRTALENASDVTKIRILEHAVLADHVHVLVSFRPDSSLSEFVRLAKSGAAYRANHVVDGTVRWARGFYAATVSREELPRRSAYIRSQFERHPDKIPPPTREPADPGRQPGVYKYQGRRSL